MTSWLYPNNHQI